MLTGVITTISAPTNAVRQLTRTLVARGSRLIVAGDRKGPAGYDLSGTIFLSLHDQLEGPFALARELPTGHYCRKNIAYLEAIRGGATCIYETDDDNAPLPSWIPRDEHLSDVRVVSGDLQGSSRSGRWVNVYRYFSDALIWPRGLPLDEIHGPVPPVGQGGRARRAPVQQGLVNGSPDVDAIWRLTMDRPFEFEANPGVYLEPGNWCPFNTQSTWWWPISYPLLYVPSFCSFRMCDIWKSFVAQRCLWALDLGVVFHAPEVIQERNPHDLMRDFRDEIPGYSRNRELADVLAGAPLAAGEENVAANLRVCYDRLVASGFLPAKEMELVDAWLGDLSRIEGRT